jgi:hypothetical protein
MSALRQLQERFQTLILGDDDAGSFARSVVATPAADAHARLGVYSHAYRARLAEVLGNDFPGLQKLAGAEGFAELCQAYIRATPSTLYNVRWYGGGLPRFLRATPPWSDTPALGEMAAFEWELGLSFDAADEPGVEAGELQALEPERWPGLRLRFNAAVRRVGLHCNVNDVRRAADQEAAIPPLRMFAGKRVCLIWRQDTVVRYRLVDEDEAAALVQVALHATFAQICEALCAWHSEETVALRAATLLRRWIQEQLVAALLVS